VPLGLTTKSAILATNAGGLGAYVRIALGGLGFLTITTLARWSSHSFNNVVFVSHRVLGDVSLRVGGPGA